MKILLIGPFYAPITGVTASNDLIKKEMPKRGYTVDVINMSLNYFEENVGRFSFSKIFFFLRISLQSYKILWFPTIYFTPGQTFYGITKYGPFLLLAKLFNKKVIIHLHGNLLLETYNKSNLLERRVLLFLLKICNKGIVLSPSLYNNLTPFISENRIFHIENFVEDSFILKESEWIHKKHDEIRIIYLSNLMTEKGIFIFLAALDKLNLKNIKYTCKIAGNIDNSISSRVKILLKSNNNIEYLGVLKGKGKRDLLLWGNVFVFPSIQAEGLPISILEAMATGNYVISTPQVALKDIFDSNEIDFIEKGSINSLVESLEKLKINNEKLHSNYSKVIALCNEDRFISKLIEIFEN